MRMRPVLVVLSLLLFAAGPADAGKQSRAARQKKAAAQKRAAARQKKAPPPTGSHAAGTLGATRHSGTAHATGSSPSALPRQEQVVASTTRGSAPAPRKMRAPQRTQSRTALGQHHRDSSAVAGMTASRSFSASAAAAPRRKPGRIRRFFAGLAVVTALTVGAFGWQAADMNGKVSGAWNYVQDRIEQVWDGGGQSGGGGGGHTDPTPFPPHSDPGPELPGPGPGPGPSNPDPGPSTPSPSGGHGHQTPQGPETDNR
jgi:hypothetical protein